MKKLVAGLLALFLSSFAAFANATGEFPPDSPAGLQGCTPGYWKNHTDAWPKFSPYENVIGRFSVPAELYPSLANITLLDGLSLKGGSGVKGASQILIRHGVAALLNVVHVELNYGMYGSQVLGVVNEALASLDREKMLAAATILESFNEWSCPLN